MPPQLGAGSMPYYLWVEVDVGAELVVCNNTAGLEVKGFITITHWIESFGFHLAFFDTNPHRTDIWRDNHLIKKASHWIAYAFEAESLEEMDQEVHTWWLYKRS